MNSHLFNATAALFDAHLSAIFDDEDEELVEGLYSLAQQARAATVADIERALAAPADAFERHAQLEAAVTIEGVESPLAVLATWRLAEAQIAAFEG